jgi:hypothetical protein
MCPYVCPVCQGGDVSRAEGLAAVFEDDDDDGGTPSSLPHSDEDPEDAALEKEKSWEMEECKVNNNNNKHAPRGLWLAYPLRCRGY